MKKEDIRLGDIYRILFGETPLIFELEVFIRTLIIYIVFLAIARWLGKRMNGQLTISELAIMLMTGAVISVPMQIPEKGLVQGFFVMLLMLLCERGSNWLAFKKPNIEELTQGKASLLVKEGVIQLEAVKVARISHQQLFSVLRGKDIHQLGEVKRMYMEACGLFSIYEADSPSPGLPIYPQTDQDVLMGMKGAGKNVCLHCGNLKEHKNDSPCLHCGGTHFTEARI